MTRILIVLVRALKIFMNIFIALVKASEVLGIPVALYRACRAIVILECTRKSYVSLLYKRVFS